MLDFMRKFDYFMMKNEIEDSGLACDNIGRSWLCRNLYCLRIGSGPKKLLFVADYAANDYHCGQYLLRWAQELGAAAERGGSYMNYNVKNLCAKNSIYILPMPNPDGVDLVVNGLKKDNPFFERVKKINPTLNFSDWQANLRGVDLVRNHDGGWMDGKMQERQRRLFAPAKSGYGGEYPESELESSSIGYFIRKLIPDSVFLINRGSGEICCDYNGVAPKDSRKTAAVLAKYSNFGLSESMKKQSLYFSTLKNWIIELFDLPCYDVYLKTDFGLPLDAEKEYLAARDLFMVANIIVA